ncbi:MAG: T9SS type A sorting domain-containing protein [Ignavibacteriae bacterium]|nr:T9SS type A sorting domain-containing protein [Ignavibacteriota bacterium]
MRRRIQTCFTITALLLLAAAVGHAQLRPVTLEEKVTKSAMIVEGRITAQSSYWDAARARIYTSNLLQVSTVFRGGFTGTEMEIITEGGTVGDVHMHLTETLELEPGDAGLFFCEPSRIPGILATNSGRSMMVYASLQGFVRYDRDGSAGGPFMSYASYSTDLRNAVTRLTGETPRVIAPLVLNFGQTNPKQKALLATPTISSFTPANRSAGQDSTITITGTNYNASRGSGTVRFKNADDGGTTYISAASAQYTSWSATSITVEVPSKAGTGTIRVFNSDPDSVTSAATLTVPYALLAATFTGNSHPTRFITDNPNGGLTWQMTPAFKGFTSAQDAFLRAFKTWRCGTNVSGGINWDIGPTTGADSIAYDGINVIRFDVGTELPSGVLGRCSSYWSLVKCGSDSAAYVTELDIVFDSGTSWYYATGAPGGSQYDFESVALHELGHGHQLAHVINSSVVMHYSIGAGATKRTLASNDTAAANAVLRRSMTADVCTYPRMTQIRANAGRDTTICTGGSVDLRAYGGITYLWSTGAGDTLATKTVSPASTTSYYVSVTNGTCLTQNDTLTVTVSSAPTASAGADKDICIGDSVRIGTATTDSISTVGTSIGVSSSIPYNTTVEDERTQMLYMKSELSAAGVKKGYITAVALQVSSTSGTKAMSSFSVSMKNTTDTSLSTGFRSGMTPVLSMTSYTPLARWDTLYFDTPFLWDGTSNLILETCFNNSGTPSASAYLVHVNLPFTLSSYRSTFVGGTGGCGASAASITPYRPIAKFIWQPKMYEWSPSAGLSRSVVSYPKASPSSTTTYTVTVTDTNGCFSSDAMVLTTHPTNPTTLTWTGAVSTAWSTAGNWDAPCAVPTAGDTVFIPSSTTPPASIPALTLDRLSYDNATSTSLAGAVTVDNVLNLVNGTIVLGSNNLSIAATGSISGGSSSAFIVTDGSGELRQAGIGSGGRTGAILFPVGDSAARYSPVTITNSGTADEFRVRVSDGVLSAGTSGSPFTTHIVGKTWHIAEAAAGGSTATVLLQWNGINETPLFTRSSSAITRYSGSWSAITTYAAAGGSNPYTRSATSVSSFGPFAVGDPSSPLPVEMADFTAERVSRGVMLRWTTVSELNSFRFVVERRAAPGLTAWDEVGSVDARGSSDRPGSYSFTDAAPPETEAVQYRLRVVDRDGSFDYSPVVTVAFRVPASVVLHSTFPNPFTTKTEIVFSIPRADAVTLDVYDANGRLVRRLEDAVLAAGYHTRSFIAGDEPNGVYRLVLSTGGGVHTSMLVLAR